MEFQVGVQHVVAKLLYRLKRLLFSNTKDLPKSDIPDDRSVTGMIGSFFLWIQSHAINGLRATASFPRISSSISLLSIYMDMEDFRIRAAGNELPESYRLSSNSRVRDSLLSTIFNSRSRLGAFELLSRGSLLLNNDQELTSVALERIYSPRPRIAEGGSLVLRAIFRRFWVRLDAPAKFLGMDSVGPTEVILEMISILDTRVKNALLHPCQILKEPIHGVLMALRNLLQEVDYLKEGDCWLDIHTRIIETVEKAFETSMCVVTSESPEGYVHGNVTDSQLILNQAFHTIKEGSQLLSTIISRAPLPLSLDSATHISFSQISKSSELIRDLLFRSRHSGTFGAMYDIFSGICKVLCESKSDFLIQIPEKWLKVINSNADHL